MNRPVLECRALYKVFTDAAEPITVFRNVNLQIAAGERVAIIGRSGAGKSTLLQLLGGLDLPTAGEVLLKGENYKNCKEKQRCTLRNKSLGFIYQLHHLLPEFTAWENVCMPLMLGGLRIKVAQRHALMLLNKAGLAKRLHHKVAQLSGGERQRVAICRALVTRPDCVLADEPTGNLDRQTATQVFAMMLQLNRELNTSLVIVTHDHSLTAQMDRVLHLRENGLVADD